MDIRKYRKYHRIAENFRKNGNLTSALYWLNKASAEVTK